MESLASGVVLTGVKFILTDFLVLFEIFDQKMSYGLNYKLGTLSSGSNVELYMTEPNSM